MNAPSAAASTTQCSSSSGPVVQRMPARITAVSLGSTGSTASPAASASTMKYACGASEIRWRSESNTRPERVARPAGLRPNEREVARQLPEADPLVQPARDWIGVVAAAGDQCGRGAGIAQPSERIVVDGPAEPEPLVVGMRPHGLELADC